LGRIERNLGHLEGAEEKLRDTLEAYARGGYHFEAALVAVDIAYTLAKRRKFEEAASLIVDLLPAFQAWGMERDCFQLWAMIRENLEHATLDEKVFDELALAIRRGWHRSLALEKK
jgi:hypothetical protein